MWFKKDHGGKRIKRIVLALAIVAMLAVPAMAQDVSVDVSGEFWGTYTAPSGGDAFFETYSPFGPSAAISHPREYSRISIDGDAGANFGFGLTYDVSFSELDEVYGAYRPGTGIVNDVRIGRVLLPVGLNEYFNFYANGVAVQGETGVFGYTLAYTGSDMLSMNKTSSSYSHGNALTFNVGTTLGNTSIGAGLFHVTDSTFGKGSVSSLASDMTDIFSVSASTGIAAFRVGGEYDLLDNGLDDKVKLLYLFGEYAYSDRTTFFARYYNVNLSGSIDSEDGNKIGVSYKLNDNASLRLMSGRGEFIGNGLEAAIKASC